MLPKKNRLQTEEFDKVFKEGERKNSPSFEFRYLLNTQNTKFGVSIPKKDTNKPEKNKLKRQIYSLLSEELLNQKPTMWGVVIYRPQKNTIFDDFKKEIKSLLKNLKDQLVE